PASNMFLGDGITRLPELLRAGVRVGLGTDGGCTNNRLSVFEEMRMASLLQRVRLLDGAALSAERALALGTASGAEILGLPAGGRRRRRGLDRAGLGHAAVPLEEHALVDDHHGRLDVPEHTRRAAQLDALGGQHVADYLARDQDDTGADGGVDDALLADDEATVGDDLTAEAAVQHHRTVEGELALDLGALVDEGGEVAGLDLGRAALPSKHPGPPRRVRERR